MTDNPVARWNAHNPQQTYHYIGKDGKPVLARVLEDQRDAALARIAQLEAKLETAFSALISGNSSARRTRHPLGPYRSARVHQCRFTASIAGAETRPERRCVMSDMIDKDAVLAIVSEGGPIGCILDQIAALPAAPMGVKVKPLEWEPIGNDPQNYRWQAKKPFGSAYYIHKNDDGLFSWVAGSDEYGPLEVAQAAAQADYEARILAALTPQPAPTLGDAAYAAGYRAGVEAAAEICAKHAGLPTGNDYENGWLRCAYIVESEIRALLNSEAKP
jgi:hypothetical protein